MNIYESQMICPCQALLDLGLSPNVKDARGLTAVYYCVAHVCNPSCLEMLLMEKAVLGSQDENGSFEIHQVEYQLSPFKLNNY